MKYLRCAFVCLFWVFLIVPATAQTFERIIIEPEANDPPYDRGLHKHWIDADEDDEDTREE